MTQTAFFPQAWAGLSPQYDRKPFSCKLADLTGVRVEHEEITNSAHFFPFIKPIPSIHNTAPALLWKIEVSVKPHPTNT